MKTRTKKSFDIARVREFCNLVNQGVSPNRALIQMGTCTNYKNPLVNAGIFWRENNGTFRAVERIHLERYELFLQEKKKYREYRTQKYLVNQKKKEAVLNSTEKRNSYKEYTKQASLFNQPKPKNTTTTHAPIVKPQTKQLSFVQRVVKSLFKL